MCIRDRIAALHKAGRPWSDIAVMYRSNLQAKVLEEELRQASVPYVMYGGQQFFERKEVKDVIAYLRVALNSREELALRRVINYPARGFVGRAPRRDHRDRHAAGDGHAAAARRRRSGAVRRRGRRPAGRGAQR